MYGYEYYYTDTTSSIATGVLAYLAIMWIIAMAVGIFMIVCNWKIYKKAGKEGWEALIPIYNIIVMIQIAELPTWYILLFLIPFANIYALFKIYIEMAHKFGKSTGFGVCMIFFGFICFPILAFDKKCVYAGSNNSNNGYGYQNFDNQQSFNNQSFNNQSFTGNYQQPDYSQQNFNMNQSYGQTVQNQVYNNQFDGQMSQNMNNNYQQSMNSNIDQNIKFCSNCGTKMNVNEIICPRCGHQS